MDVSDGFEPFAGRLLRSPNYNSEELLGCYSTEAAHFSADIVRAASIYSSNRGHPSSRGMRHGVWLQSLAGSA